MKILIGVDDSRFSSAAVDFVKRMPWPKDAKFIVVSAVRPLVGVYAESYVPAVPPDYDQLTRDLTKIHEEAVSSAERELRSAGLQTTAKVLRGDPRPLLVDTAKTEGADLVIVGSHGQTGLTKLIMGSVASHVVTHAPCSVLVVREKKPAAV
jgi:nucleotide-binding universal stress UspA family protein